MKQLLALLLILFLYNAAFAQQVGSKVSFTATDGKTYTGVVKEIQNDQYKIKYDGFDFESWLAGNQFTVTDAPAQTGGNMPALPEPTPQTIPQTTPQTYPTNTPDNTTYPNTQPMQQSTAAMSKTDSLKMAYNNAKNTLNEAKTTFADAKSTFADLTKLFAGKKETMVIVVPDVEYETAGLRELKESLKKVRGVKSVVMHYNASTATFEIEHKSSPTDIWDNVSGEAKTKFKIVEAGENVIKVKYKEKTP